MNLIQKYINDKQSINSEPINLSSLCVEARTEVFTSSLANALSFDGSQDYIRPMPIEPMMSTVSTVSTVSVLESRVNILESAISRLTDELNEMRRHMSPSLSLSEITYPINNNAIRIDNLPAEMIFGSNDFTVEFTATGETFQVTNLKVRIAD